MAEATNAESEDQDALTQIPRLDAIPCTLADVDRFLLEVEAFGKRFGKEDELLVIAKSRMGIEVLCFFERRMKALHPEREENFKTLAYLMSKLVSFKSAEVLLHEKLESIEHDKHNPAGLYVEFGLAYDEYVRFCERTDSAVQVTENSLQSKYISFLDSGIASEISTVKELHGEPDILRCTEIAEEASIRAKYDLRQRYLID